MPRRRLGLLLLLLVLPVIAVLARLPGERVPGIGSAPAHLGIPQAGTCVTSLQHEPGGLRPASRTGLLSLGEPAVEFGSCDDPHVGEVLASRLLIEPIPIDAQSDGRWCRQVSNAYVRHRTSALEASAITKWWTPVVGYGFAVVLSTPGLASYRWAACAVLAPRGEAYHGRATTLARTTPAPFGECRDDIVVVSCTAPHDSQDFGVGLPPSDIDYRASCVELVRQMTGLADPAAGGRLVVEVVRPDGQDVTAPTNRSPASGLRCQIRSTDGNRLAATLTGIGAQPIPWAP